MKQNLVLDTSAIIAILTSEAENEALFDQITRASSILFPANCVLDAVIVLTRRTDAGVEEARADVLELLTQINASMAPFCASAMDYALHGNRHFGKGTGIAPYVFNVGDCLSYGVAKASGGKLLYTGGDFGLTDVG